MKILITGAKGYLGKTLYNYLKDKYDVVGLSRNDFDLTNNYEVGKFFDNNYFDIVFHCAAKGVNNPRSDDWSIMDDNLKMYYNLLENKSHFGKFINFGSGAEISMNHLPYGFSKEVIYKSILNKDNFYNIRIYGLFDENELDTRFIKSNIKRYINKESMVVYQNKYMDFFYMEDLIKVIDYYINQNLLPKLFECCYKNTVSLLNIINIINKLDNYKVYIPEIDEAEYILGQAYTGSYVNLNINYIGLEQGIKNVYNKLKNEH